MEYVDRTLTCVECGARFLFSASEQAFFHEKGYTNEPKRCPVCRARHKAALGKARIETSITCSECGAQATVPFEPVHGKPVLCRSCFLKKRTKASRG